MNDQLCIADHFFLQNCVKMKFVADDSGNLEKAGWDDIDCEKKPIKSVCQYSVL